MTDDIPGNPQWSTWGGVQPKKQSSFFGRATRAPEGHIDSRCEHQILFLANFWPLSLAHRVSMCKSTPFLRNSLADFTCTSSVDVYIRCQGRASTKVPAGSCWPWCHLLPFRLLALRFALRLFLLIDHYFYWVVLHSVAFAAKLEH